MKNLRSRNSSTLTSSLVVLFFVASLTACKKDSDPTPSGVAGDWQLTAINIVPAFSGISDYLAIYTLTGDNCPSQTKFSFKANNPNNSLEITAPASCTATKNELIDLIGVDNTTTWQEVNNQLILTTGTFVMPVNLSVNSTSMSLSVTDLALSDNVNHTVTFVFKRI